MLKCVCISSLCRVSASASCIPALSFQFQGEGESLTTLSLQSAGQRIGSVYLAEKLCSFYLLGHNRSTPRVCNRGRNEWIGGWAPWTVDCGCEKVVSEDGEILSIPPCKRNSSRPLPSTAVRGYPRLAVLNIKTYGPYRYTRRIVRA